MSALPHLNIKSKIKISDELFEMMLEDPRMMLASMIEAKEENGYKLYDIKLDKGKLEVNGKPMM